MPVLHTPKSLTTRLLWYVHVQDVGGKKNMCHDWTHAKQTRLGKAVLNP